MSLLVVKLGILYFLNTTLLTMYLDHHFQNSWQECEFFISTFRYQLFELSYSYLFLFLVGLHLDWWYPTRNFF